MSGCRADRWIRSQLKGHKTTLPRQRRTDDQKEFAKVSEQGEAILNILNSGYSKALGFVRRCVGETHKPQAFVCYCPKLVAARRKFRDQATESRTITHNSYKVERLDIPQLLLNELYQEVATIQNQLLRRRFDKSVTQQNFMWFLSKSKQERTHFNLLLCLIQNCLFAQEKLFAFKSRIFVGQFNKFHTFFLMF